MRYVFKIVPIVFTYANGVLDLCGGFPGTNISNSLDFLSLFETLTKMTLLCAHRFLLLFVFVVYNLREKY